MFWKAAGHALECVSTLHSPNRILETYRRCELRTKCELSLGSQVISGGANFATELRETIHDGRSTSELTASDARLLLFSKK